MQMCIMLYYWANKMMMVMIPRDDKTWIDYKTVVEWRGIAFGLNRQI